MGEWGEEGLDVVESSFLMAFGMEGDGDPEVGIRDWVLREMGEGELGEL